MKKNTSSNIEKILLLVEFLIIKITNLNLIILKIPFIAVDKAVYISIPTGSGRYPFNGSISDTRSKHSV